jgi:hypothetical protein
MASQEEKTVEGLLREGKIINSYGKYTLVTVSPVEDIDKIKFSIVKLNTGGKEHADFYLGTRDFIELCNEIDCGKFMLDVKTSLQNNSNIKEYVSGVNGSKNMTFRTGNKGFIKQIFIS